MADHINFDVLAAEWDAHPVRAGLTKAVAVAMRDTVDLSACEKALEVGCGTGSLAILLASDVGHVVATDSSPQMVEELRRKLAQVHVGNITAVCVDFLEEELPDDQYDLIFTVMAMHHVASVPFMLERLRGCLADDGALVVVDLCEEDGSFHGPEIHVPHLGFSEETIRALLGDAGYCLEDLKTIHTIEKNNNAFPVFLALARVDAPRD